MATLEELEAGLRKAHAAGNADHARRFADAIRQMRGSQPKQRITAEQARDPSLIPDERYRAAGMEPPASGKSLCGAEKRRRRKARAAQIPPAAGSDVPPTGI